MPTDTVSCNQELDDLIRARYCIIYIVSPEERRIVGEIKKIAKHRKRKLILWSITKGFMQIKAESRREEIYSDVKDPFKSLDTIERFEDHGIFILKDFHPYLTDPNIARKLRDLNTELKDPETAKFKKTIIILSPIFKLPMEIEKEISVIDYSLPNRDEIEKIVWQVLRSVPESLRDRVRAVREDNEFRYRIVEAALGLTAEEAENVFSKSLVRKREFDLETILSEKKHIIRKSGLLEFYETDQDFGDIGGLDNLKSWLNTREHAFSIKARNFGLPLPKGILLIGIPGCGKSLTAKAVGAMWKMPLLRFDIGKVMSGLVGSSEENMRKAINTAEAVAPAILWLDELEKGFSGVKSSGFSDAGTTARVFGSFITWLQEKESPVFVIATANDVSLLPPELMRKGRFDEIFFVDLPTPEERKDIVNIHIARKGRNPEEFEASKVVAATQGFSGSEIEQCVISALYDVFDRGQGEQDIKTEDVVNGAREIIPLSFTMKEGIDQLRDWAKTRARRASPEFKDYDDEEIGISQLEM